MTGAQYFRFIPATNGLEGSVILPPEHSDSVVSRRVADETAQQDSRVRVPSCDSSCSNWATLTSGKASQTTTRPPSANRIQQPAKTAEDASVSALTLSSPTALLSSAPEWQAQFFKTKLCPFFVKDIPDQQTATQVGQNMGHNVGNCRGVCINKNACRFAHSFEELRPLPDLRKTKLCSSYTKRIPCKNSKCPFAHSPQELRTSSSVFYKVTLCNFYKNGRCWNGSNCRFAHGNDELRNTDTTKVNRKSKQEGLLPTPVPPPPPGRRRRRTTQCSEDSLLSQLLSNSAPQPEFDPFASCDLQKLVDGVDTEPPPGFSPSKSPPPDVATTEALVSLLLSAAPPGCQSAFSQSTSPSQADTPKMTTEESTSSIDTVQGIFNALSDALTSTDPVEVMPTQDLQTIESEQENLDSVYYRYLMNLLRGAPDNE